MPDHTKTVLHVGCGAYGPAKLHPVFRDGTWQELRLDIDANAKPDIVASITDMAPIEDGTMDAVFSSHNLEHLYPHEVPLALGEFRRALKPDGFALITLPDLQAVAAVVAEGCLTEAAYQSTMGPITPLDMIYGFGPALAANNLFMAHHCGFTGRSLMSAFAASGFAFSVVQRQPASFALWAIAFAEQPAASVLADAQDKMLPLHMAAKQLRLPEVTPVA